MSQYPQPPQSPYGNLPPGIPAGYGSSVPPPSLSVTSLLSLILSLTVPLIGGICGVIFGLLGLKDTKKPWKTGRALAIAGLILGSLNTIGGLALVLSLVIPGVGKVRQAQENTQVASQMRMTMTGIVLYANDNRGKLPSSLDELSKGGTVSATTVLCPSSGKPFVYVMPSESQIHRIKAPGDVVIVYNPPDRVASRALICGFADGHVEILTGDEAAKTFVELQAGRTMLKPRRGG